MSTLLEDWIVWGGNMPDMIDTDNLPEVEGVTQ